MLLAADREKVWEDELPPRLATGAELVGCSCRFTCRLLGLQCQSLKEKPLVGAGHITLTTRGKECLLEERQLLVSPLEGRFLLR